MAGWKLRKDKAQTETSEGETQETEPASARTGAEIYSTDTADPLVPSVIPALSGLQTTTVQEPEQALSPDFEIGSELHFEEEGTEDGPLTLMDYSAPDLLPLPEPTIIAGAPPEEAAALPETAAERAEEAATLPETRMPSFDTSAADTDGPIGDFTSTLRMSREELAAAFAPASPAGIPTVPPFVLDTPLVAPAMDTTSPRLVLRVGRLSAAFDLTREVTTIGRPDSELHYYPDVEIDMDDAVSRRHAEIVKREDHYFLVDTGSTNGTLLNGEKLPSHEERPLTHGDRIRVGERTEIIFE